MKVQVARASDRFNETTVDMQWAGQFADELLKLDEKIPAPENSWAQDKDGPDFSYIVSVNKDTRKVEIMIYDDYVE